MTDTKRLREAISASGLKYKYIANALNLSAFGLQKKIDNVTEFKASEIVALSKVLSLSDQQSKAIFFADEGDFKSLKGAVAIKEGTK